MKITENKEEMIALGRQIAAENPQKYPPELFARLYEVTKALVPSEQRFAEMYYSAVYCQAVYGSDLQEYGTFGFENKTHAKRSQYMTRYNRIPYLQFLNSESDTHLLDNKYTAYQLLKPFYKRDAMLLADENDYETFCRFARKHKSIFVKPLNLARAEGVHRLTIEDTADLRQIFDALLDEARHIVSHEGNDHILYKLILEEEIIPSAEIAQFNPAEMCLLRVTTVLVNGTVHFLYPCFRMMCGDGKSQSGEAYSIDALIDAETGILVTDGIHSFFTTERHPVSGVPIKGFAMPDWEQLKNMLRTAAHLFPTVRYIGWDVTHTDKGWCIIEGNHCGEFFSQMCLGHGIKEEFGRLIGFEPPLEENDFLL